MKFASVVLVLGLVAIASASMEAGTFHSISRFDIQSATLAAFARHGSLHPHPSLPSILHLERVAADCPDFASLEQKFGTFEQFVRSKTPDAVKVWLDSVPAAFDASSQAWNRAIHCTKNLADNAAVNVYGAVAHARSIEHFAKQKRGLAKGQFFSTEPKAPKPLDVIQMEKDAKASNLQIFSKKLELCFATQQDLVKDAVIESTARLAMDVFRPEAALASTYMPKVQPAMVSGFRELLVQAKAVLADAVNAAANRALSMQVADAPTAAFMNPALGYALGSSYCGTHRACLNGGRCLADNQCACPLQWGGHSCSEPAAPCAAYNIACQHGGQCQAAMGQWSCACPPGTQGLYCERVVPAAAPVQLPVAGPIALPVDHNVVAVAPSASIPGPVAVAVPVAPGVAGVVAVSPSAPAPVPGAARSASLIAHFIELDAEAEQAAAEMTASLVAHRAAQTAEAQAFVETHAFASVDEAQEQEHAAEEQAYSYSAPVPANGRVEAEEVSSLAARAPEVVAAPRSAVAEEPPYIEAEYK